jgi:hypothetical protein
MVRFRNRIKNQQHFAMNHTEASARMSALRNKVARMAKRHLSAHWSVIMLFQDTRFSSVFVKSFWFGINNRCSSDPSVWNGFEPIQIQLGLAVPYRHREFKRFVNAGKTAGLDIFAAVVDG